MFERIPSMLQAFGEAVPTSQTNAGSAAQQENPTPRRARSADWALASVTSIAFSLAFFVGGLVLLLGLSPASLARMSPSVDLAVLVLIVPLCALSLAMIVEVLRAAIFGLPRVQPPRLAPVLSDWRPGRGEG